MRFCVRDDDTSYFTSPEELEKVYSRWTRLGPVCLSVVPFCCAGNSKGVPARNRGKWTIHPLEENRALVEYLRTAVGEGRYEIMLHGHYHDQEGKSPEFVGGRELANRVTVGRNYLEGLLETRVRVFVPPHNAIRRPGLKAVVHAGMHLGCAAGLRSGWPLFSGLSWTAWRRMRRWKLAGGQGFPWIIDLGDHREIACRSVTPGASISRNKTSIDQARSVDGVCCLATHYWEMDAPSVVVGDPSVGEHLERLLEYASSQPGTERVSLGDLLCNTPRVSPQPPATTRDPLGMPPAGHNENTHPSCPIQRSGEGA